MKVCDKTCIFFFFPIINKYFLMAKRSLLSRCPSYMAARGKDITRAIDPAEDQRGRKCDVRYLRWSWCAAGAGEDGMWVMGPFRGMRTATDRLQEVEYGT